MIRRFGEAHQSGVNYTRRPGAYAILRDGHDLLLTKYQADYDELQLPGGGIDPGESATQALHREVMEETGWHIARPRFFGTFRRFCFMPEYDLWAEKICHIYTAQPTRRICAPTESEHSAVWVPITDAAETLTNAGDRHFVQRLLA
ncbi:NUDIX domain-containing protein [Cochlodiniinecator piscidefendens]|uniref:NUDIX domain-containing protein n=1 Tax=Cochlodiniinecator piscidefendens TaxID=2715756 RepID=UPI00140923A8